jgi:hypothetical protein
MKDNEVSLKLLYLGHNNVEMSLLKGALESEGIACVEKRDVGMVDQAPSRFYSPATESKLYVAAADWVKAEELARTVIGDDYEPPPEKRSSGT